MLIQSTKTNKNKASSSDDGDGTNDAPALCKPMRHEHVQAAKEAGNMVDLDNILPS
jgi:high-affinity K+ transport system ATPase subunit B